VSSSGSKSRAQRAADEPRPSRGELPSDTAVAEVPRRYDSGGRRLGGTGLPLSLPEYIGQVLEQDIIRGALAAGQRVTEAELAKRVGVSRTPVREAMRMLEAQGLIVHRRDKGTFVAERTQTAEAATIYELRASLEGHLAAQAAELITAEELDVAQRLHDEFRHEVELGAPDVRRIVAIDSDLHWTIYNAANSDFVSIVGTYWGRLQRELYDPVYRSDPMTFADQHGQIIAALRAHDPEATRSAMVAHIRSGWAAIERSYASAAAAE
jgi:DNA-binding GntR family transcriptional regulator